MEATPNSCSVKDHAARGLVMRIDNIPNFWIPEWLRSRFEREDTLAGVLGLYGWEMFLWHNWRRIGIWLMLVLFGVGSVLSSAVDGVTFFLARPCRVYGDVEGLLTAAASAPQVPELHVGLAKDVINSTSDVACALAGFLHIFCD